MSLERLTEAQLNRHIERSIRFILFVNKPQLKELAIHISNPLPSKKIFDQAHYLEHKKAMVELDDALKQTAETLRVLTKSKARSMRNNNTRQLVLINRLLKETLANQRLLLKLHSDMQDMFNDNYYTIREYLLELITEAFGALPNRVVSKPTLIEH